MAGIDLGPSGGRRRALNSELNMIPFIDLLLVTTAFLLITAVWANSGRLVANAEVPGNEGCGDECRDPDKKKLHVHVEPNAFRLAWRQSATVLSEVTIPKQAVLAGASGEALRYPDLAEKIDHEWRDGGAHRDPSDRAIDEAVIHVDDRTSFREIAAVLDAIASPKREIASPAGRVKVAAFNPVFSVK